MVDVPIIAIPKGPCKYIERPKRDKFKAETLDVNEIKLLIGVLDLGNMYDYMFFLGTTLTLELGLRRGELGGLDMVLFMKKIYLTV